MLYQNIASWADRAIISFLVGVHAFNDPDAQYEPRADWDFDGVIEESDLIAFDQEICLIDLNADDAVDLADYFQFFAWWDTNDLQADLTADGVLDLADQFLFFELYDRACI